MEKEQNDNKNYLRIIYLISALIPLVVAFLILFPSKLSLEGDWIKVLPAVHATINSITAISLVAAFFAIRNGNIQLHKRLMFLSLFLGVLFLVSYVLYHSSVDSVKFGDIDHDGVLSETELATAGSTRSIYLFVLASHILLSILVVPFVLFAFYYALTDQIDRHKKMIKFTFPVWLYVSITGVIVYYLISPYYL